MRKSPTRVLGVRVLRSVIVLTAVALAVPSTATAQGLMIAPNAVVVDAKTKTSALTLVNAGDRSVEVSLSTTYGYPATDSVGGMYLRTFDRIEDSMPSASNWIRMYPQRLLLEPGARRTVRVVVTPPEGLSEGEYWARIVVASRETAPTAIEMAGTAPDVKIGLNLEIRSVLGLFYRNGNVRTAIGLDSARYSLTQDSVFARVQMVRKGNAAFVGSLRATLRDSAGVARVQRTLPLGVYYALDPRIALPRDGLTPGRYTLTLDAVSSRPDVADRLLLPVPPVHDSVHVRIP